MSDVDGELSAKASALRALEETIERLRGPEGCPWDRAQTLGSMGPHLLEEVCEALDAIEAANGAPTPALCEELGDVLMNVLLTARIAEEAGAFGIREVAESISTKLIRRHPHVFGAERVSSVEEVLSRWNAIKAQETAGKPQEPASRLAGVPRSLPALAAAAKVGERAAEAGFDWPDAAGALHKVEEELSEVARALAAAPAGSEAPPPVEEVRREVGDLLFAAVNLARKSGVDAEAALRGAVERFRRRFRYLEERADLSRASPAEMEALWQEAKSDGI